MAVSSGFPPSGRARHNSEQVALSNVGQSVGIPSDCKEEVAKVRAVSFLQQARRVCGDLQIRLSLEVRSGRYDARRCVLSASGLSQRYRGQSDTPVQDLSWARCSQAVLPSLPF